MRDFSDEHDYDDYTEEKALMEAVSRSVCELGKWSLTFYRNEEHIFAEPQSRAYAS